MLDRKGLHSRAAFFRAVRFFFDSHAFLEVDTPIRQPLVIPEQNISHIPSSDHFLQSSPELYMKRLLATSGCEHLYQICRCFRHGECGRLHLEEFVMLEWYRKGADYKDLMRDCEQLIRYLCATIKDHSFPQDVERPWEYSTVAEAFTKYSSMTVNEALQKDCFEELLVEDVEPQLGRGCPTFLYDYPLELASLARQKRDAPALAERFELYVTGVEIANGFSELTDPEIQRERFFMEYSAMESVHTTMPEQFLTSLDKLDEAAGIAMGLDRLFMLFMGKDNLQEIISFPPEELDM
jgi:elongation factor P--(R)-beta-lysine ligase